MCCQCCCGQQRHHERGCDCGYQEGHGHRRRFLSKAEKIEKLKNYAEELRKELTAVEEHIKELKK